MSEVAAEAGGGLGGSYTEGTSLDTAYSPNEGTTDQDTSYGEDNDPGVQSEAPEQEESSTPFDSFFGKTPQQRAGVPHPVQQKVQQVHQAAYQAINTMANEYDKARTAWEAERVYLPPEEAYRRGLELEDARLKLMSHAQEMAQTAREVAMEPVVRTHALNELTNIVLRSVPKGAISKQQVASALENTSSAQSAFEVARSMAIMARQGNLAQRAQRGTDWMGSGGVQNTNFDVRKVDTLTALTRAYKMSKPG